LAISGRDFLGWMGLLFWQEEGDGDGVANTLIRRNLGRTFLSNGFNYKVKILGGFPAHPVAPPFQWGLRHRHRGGNPTGSDSHKFTIIYKEIL